MIFSFSLTGQVFLLMLYCIWLVMWYDKISVKPAKWHPTQVCQLSPTGQALQPVFTLCCRFLKEQSHPLAMIHSVSGAFWTNKSKKFFHKSLNDSFLIMFHSHMSVCVFFMLFLLRSRRSSSPARRRREWSWGRCSQIPICRSDVNLLHVLDSSYLHSTYNPFRRTSALDTY